MLSPSATIARVLGPSTSMVSTAAARMNGVPAEGFCAVTEPPAQAELSGKLLMLLAAIAPSTSKETYNSFPEATGNAIGSLVTRPCALVVKEGEPPKVSATGAEVRFPWVPASAMVAACKVNDPSPALKLIRRREPDRPMGILERYMVRVEVLTDV